MADNSFSRDPVEQLIVDATGGSAPDARSGIDDLARKSRVPANFLMAFSEASGAPDDAGKVKVASAVAAKIAPRLAAGEKIEDIVKSVAGDEAEATAFIERAYQIADELYPAPARPKEDQPGVLGDMARSFGGSLVKGAGGMIEAAGIAAEEFADPVGAEFGQQPGPVRKGAKAAADLVRGFGERIQEGMSDDAKAAIKDSMPDGDLFSPSTWTVGKNASLRGYAMLATDVLGSFAPVVATAILTKNPAVAAGVGGLQGAGAAAETGRSIVEEAARTIGPDGKSLLEAGSPYYREALASGKSPEEALALTVAATERMAALLTAPISAFGGAATGKIIGKGFESLATKGPLGRILGTAVASSLEEGIQEAAETIATRYGTKSASGLDISLTEGTFGDFLLGALGGSLPGAVAGGFHGGGKDDQEEAPARPRAQPTPPLAEPTQGIDETPPPVAGNPTSPSPVTPPAPPAPAAPGAVIDPMADYLGKLTKFSAATKGAAIPAGSPASAQFDSLISGARRHGATEEEIDAALRLGTQPQPARPTRDIAATLPEPVFGKEVMGADVTVETGGMTPFIGKIIRDNGNTITIRDAEGDEIEVAHVQIERGEVILSAADAATPSIPAPQGSATNATGALTPATPVDPGALTLSQQAMTKITPPKLEDAAPITPEDAAKRMRFIESQAETSGWTEAMRKMHADLRAIAQPVTPTTATPDMGEVAVTPAAGSTPAPAAGEQLPAGPVAPKALDGEIITPEDDRRLEAEAAAAVGIEMTDAPVLTRAAWWDAADDDVRKAILDEAGPKAAAEYRRAMTFQKSSEDARRAISEAYGRLYLAGKIRNDGSIEAPKPVLAGPAQDAAKPIAQDAPAPGAAPEGPTGKTYRLDKGISDRHRKALAKFRGSTVDDIISQIDHNARRAEAQLRAKGIDIDDLDADGRDKAGQFHQEGVLIREAEALAADLLEEAIGKRSGDLGYPNKDEDTGEFENDGTPIGEALMWLDTFEAMGIGTDTITEDAPDIFDATRAIPEKPEAEIFPAVKGTVNIDAQAEREGEISLEDAKARVDFWKQTAKEIGKTGANSKKIIISLFDYTGAWSQPWADAGYQVIRHDIKSGSDIITDAWITEQIRERRQEGFEVYGVLSACPCTTFAGSGARWWEELHDVKSPEALAKVFGEKALSSGAKSALEYNLMLVQATRDVIAAANPTAFHVLENPIGRIEDKAGMPKPTARFHPHNFGDPYTKRTQLFGTFQTGLPTANVHPAEGSKMQSQLRGTDPLGKEARSTTPEGFSYAFFMANDPEARKRRGDQPKAAPVAPKAPTKAVEDAPQAALQLSIAPIRERGAVLKGRPETEKPEVDGVLFTWDAKEAGWIFARRHTDKVAQALGIGKAADPAQQDAPQQALPGLDIPTKAEVKAAVAEVDTAPTDGQKKAGNYKMAHVTWNGLDITIETPKGAERSGTDKDGDTWSVTMPAHYGYLKRTEGADGDHVDVYLGEALDSEKVFVVDQVDADTKAFDEHKVMLGFPSALEAEIAYLGAFSDGKGRARLGAITPMSLRAFKEAVAKPESWTSGPLGRINAPQPEASSAELPADEKVSAALTAQIESEKAKARRARSDGKNEKAAVHETNLRRLRMNTFAAEDAAIAALEQGDFAPFAKYEADFPLAAAELRTAIGAAAPKPKPYEPTVENFPFADSEAGNPGPRARAWLAKASDKTLLAVPPSGLADGWLRAERQRRKIGEYAEKPETKPVDVKKGWTKIGTNARGNPLFEDERGVRSYTESGVRITEAVGFIPGGGIVVKADQRGRDYLTKEEWDAKSGAQPVAPKPAEKETDKAKAIRLFSEAVQSGNTAGVASLRPALVAMLGEPATASIEAKAKSAQPDAAPKTRSPATQFRETYANSIAGMRENPDLADVVAYADWLASLTDEQWARADKVFDRSYNPFLNPISINIEQSRKDIEAAIADPVAAPKKKNFGDIDESAMSDPKMPNGYELTVIRRMTKAEAAAEGYGWPAMKAVVKRDRPYSYKVESYISETSRADAIRGALKLAQKGAIEPETATQAAPPPTEAPAVAPKKNALSGLSQAKQDEAALLRARIAERMRTQMNTGLDPEMLKDAIKLVGIYIEAGLKRFKELVEQVAGDMGMAPIQIEPWARAAYNQARDDMELDGADVSDMDDAKAVLSATRALRAEASQKPAKSAIMPEDTAGEPKNGNDQGQRANAGEVGQDGEPDTSGQGRADRDTAGTTTAGRMGDGQAGSGGVDDSMGGAEGAGARSGRPDRQAVDRGNERGDAAERREPDSVVGLGDAGPDRGRPAGRGRANYRITDPDALFAGGPKARFAKNRAAMEALQSITDENREPTPEELDAMAAFIGWGSFGQELFQGSWEYPRPKDGWKDEDKWLRDHLGKEAWQSAQTSIINAHYTDPPTVTAIWDMIRKMGFTGGRVLEPAMGVGNFFGMMPAQLEQTSQLTGIELEQTTGSIAQLLYPRANVKIMGYEQSKTPDGFYDLVIGNWPFANIKIADRRYDKLSPSLHDYFFVKALDQVRAGGLVVGITSAFSMDGQKNKNIRAHLARNAELVAAFRLPSGAFEKYAGTKVVTDIIILRKRDLPIMSTTDETWVQSVPFKTPSGETINVNQYYLENPSHVLGTLDSGHGTTYGKAGMIVHRPDDIGARLSNLADMVPAGAYSPIARGKEPRFVANTSTDRRWAITIGKDGALYQVQGDHMAALEDVARIKGPSAKATAERIDQIKALIALRKAADDVIAADRDGAEDADKKRRALKALYTDFSKTHGLIKDSFALGIMRKLRDPNTGVVAALETKDGKPAAIMERAIVRAARKIEQPTIRDAFVMARNESLHVDLDKIAETAGATRDQVIADLSASKAIYRTPGGAYIPSDVYLSGNVRQKLAEARAAQEDGEDMQASIDALIEVQPPDVPYFQIEARFGADWLRPEINRQFIIDTLGLKDAQENDIVLTRAVTGWRVEVSDRVKNMGGITDITGAPLSGRRGTGLSLRRFLEATLNTQTITVTYEDEDGVFKDTKATEQANQKAGELRQKFGSWLWSDPERRVEAERAYNDIMNAIATPQVDGSFLEFPGMALARGDQPFNLRQHQSNAIWRGIMNQRGIYGHEVGTGKTITMAGIAIESRRYGLARKPLLIAHNANSAAVATEAQDTYPGAKILYVNNLAPDEIDAQLARMATEDWDLIVIPHSLLDRMSLTRETLMDMAAADIEAYEREAIEAAEQDGIELTVADLDDTDGLRKKRLSVTAKEMVKARQRLLQNIEKQSQRASREGAISFEKLGIDMILVDESHEFKKPPLATRMQVRGLNTGTSNKSLSLRFLTSYVKAQRGGTGVHVFTGTPITNTLGEIYHQMYYVMDDVMRANGVDTWDGFFKTFADTVSDVELTATGDFENVERLAAFINVSELRRMAGQFLDIVFASDMPEFTPRATPSGKTISDRGLTAEERDFLENGRTENPIGRPYKKVIHDIGPMGNDQKRILDEVAFYARAFKAADGKRRMEIMRAGGPDAPIVYNNVPNRASMDARLHEPDAEDHPQSKANRAVRNIARIYADEPMSAQVLFMDEGYSDESVSVKTNADGSKTKTKKRKFNLANDIVEKLVAAGVKREQIAIVAGGVTADQKKAIADAMNDGKIRVVIGQTATLGVGVNMQKYLRAMHHLDAPWMPGDLEQRNGRGERQGNTWNTVMEYRYLTEGLDGRRWQVLAVKDRFIKAFLQAKDGVRVIEGDATDDAATLDGSSLSETLSQAAGDPRLMLVTKLKKDIERLQQRERIHTQGIADAISREKGLKARIDRINVELPPLRSDAEHIAAFREAGTFTATVNGTTFDSRAEAAEAINAFLATEAARLPKGESKVLPLEINGFAVKLDRPRWSYKAEDITVEVMRRFTVFAHQPTMASIENAIRRIPAAVESRETEIAETNDQIARLERMKNEPFQQAGDLAARKTRLDAILADLQDNPVPPPSWLRIGAPMDSLVYVDGQERVVTGHRWTKTGYFVSTEQGDVPYLDAKDAAGVPLYEEVEFMAPEVSEGSKMRDGSKKPDEVSQEDQSDGADTAESRFMRRDPVAELTGNELGGWSDIRDLGRKAEAWYRENLIGTTVTNTATGMVIRFNARGAKKTTGRKGDDLYRLVPALRAILAGGRVVGTEVDRLGRAEVEAIHKVQAEVSLEGRSISVIATVRQMRDGTFHYDLSKESGGAEVLQGKNPANPTVELRSPTSALEGDPATLNLDIAEAEINPAPDEAGLTDAVAAVMRQHGIAGKVPVALVRGLIGERGRRIAGRFRASDGIALDQDSGDVLGTLRHEIVHVLRRAFTPAEWEALVRAAKRRPGIKDRVNRHYGDKSIAYREEEMVAELHRETAAEAAPDGAIGRLLGRIRSFIEALGNGLRGRGFVSASGTLDALASGKIGARLQARGADGRFVAEQRVWHGSPHEFDRNERTFLGNVLTNAMDGKGGVNLLALVPGRALFAELGKNIPSARAYLRHKEEMDAMRNEWHARTDETAQAWRKLIARDGAANAAMMDLMHDATIAGVDPSTRFKQRDDNFARKAFEFVSEHGDAAPDWARALVEGQERRRMAHGPLAERFAALPPEFRAMFTRVRDSYDTLATAIEDAVIANAEKGMKVNIERAELRYKDALDQIRDDGLTGEDKDKAEAEAKEKLDEAKRRAAFSKGARIAALRAKFESNRLDGPYFPLARFGNFFVTVRDKESGKVLSFSRFEKEQDQKRAAAEWRAEDAYDVQIGTLADAKALRQQVDPSFVADIEDILGEAAADEGVMDMVWQRWLETLPDMSIRRTRLHRKGTPGYDTDAFRAFGRQMFHGAHQLARMSFAMDMSRNLEDARREAAQTSDPNRNGLIVNEMERRHEFTMNPKGGAWAQIASSAAFVYYLAVTPAAAAVNLSQTTIVGVPVLAAGFENGKIADAAAHILRASKDFLGGRFSVERSRTLTADEHRAMTEAYRRGTIDKSQAHDLAGVAETGVEYNDFRSRWMARLSFLFHHAERANREVTFLAAYRMAREHGMDHGNAIERAADLTWKTHFDYQNTSRPRLMQNDAAKVLLTFRNFTVNLNWRLFRDAHQMLKGATKEERREARTQLIGITAMMMLHAGITGTWGYTLITTLLGLFADDGDDDVEEALQSALVNTFGPQIAGILLKGVPGHLTGINLSERIGMPSLWFRESDRNLEGDDVYNYWLTELIGPVPGIVENTFRGVQMAWDGDVQRGVETVMPKAIRDIMQAYRYASEGVTTLSGNPILDDTSIADSFKKALGFSPARISERYEANTRLRNAEKRIEGERSDILSDAAREVMAGEPMSERVRRKIERFNRENPGYPIDGKTISRSVKARQRAVQEMEGGIRLNRRLNERLREEAAPPIYN